MKSLEALGLYTRVGDIIESKNAHLFDVQGPDGNIYIAKVPKHLDAGTSAARQFTQVARHVKKIKSDYINRVIDSGVDSESNAFYIILDKVEGSVTLENLVDKELEVTPSYLNRILDIWYKVSDGLNQASTKNIFHKDLHPRNILIHSEGHPVIIDFGISILEHTISKQVYENEFSNKFTAPELITKQESRNQAKADFYSLGLCVLYALLGHKLFYEQENNYTRIQRVLDLYQSHCKPEGLELFKSCLIKSTSSDIEERFHRYTELRDMLSETMENLIVDDELPLALNFWESGLSDKFIEQANHEGLRISIQKGRHSVHKFVRAKMATSGFYVHSANASNKGNVIDIRNLKRVEDLTEQERRSHSYIIENSEVCGVKRFVNKTPESSNRNQFIDAQRYLENEYRELMEISPIQLNREPRRILQDYLNLLKEEIEHLRKNAFSIKYKSIGESKNEHWIEVNTSEPDSLESIHNFMKRSRAAYRRGNEIELLAKRSDSDESAVKIGYTTFFNKGKNQLVIREFPKQLKDEIPVNGLLQEDTSILEIQYKRQIYAIKSYMRGEITNPELRDYLFQPDRLATKAESVGMINPEFDVLSVDPAGEKVRFQDAQLMAIAKALFTPPVTIIQGPPGTGKTTVITELIRQVLSADKQKKILITSQTNLAVDNVLSRVTGDENVSFMRLGRTIDDEELAEHSFDTKLSLWARSAKSKSDKYFKNLKDQLSSKENELPPSLATISRELHKKAQWKHTAKEIRRILDSPFSADFQILKQHLASRADFESAFAEHLDDDFQQLDKLRQLKRKWNSILSNIENHDALKSKFISSINIIGATANHIAASKYRDFKFEFDYIIMDEAAKATPAETLVPCNMGHNIVLVGDHKQLPPLVTATESVKKAIENRLDNEGELIDFDKIYLDKPSLFEIMFDGAPDEFKEMLDLQFRMPKQIGDVVSKLVYGGKLRSIDDSGKKHELNLSSTTSMFMIDTGKHPNRFHQIEPTSKSSYNRLNASVVIETLKLIDKHKSLFTDLRNDPYSVGVITGYGKQAEFLSDELYNHHFDNLKLNKNLTVATVDSFQGAEKDIIIYDLVRSAKPNSGVGLGFLEMPNRINVALTRAKRLLIIVGDTQFVLNVHPSHRWKTHHPDEPLLLQEFIGTLHEEGLVYDNPEDIIHG